MKVNGSEEYKYSPVIVTNLFPLFEKMGLLILNCVKVNGSEEYKYLMISLWMQKRNDLSVWCNVTSIEANLKIKVIMLQCVIKGSESNAL